MRDWHVDAGKWPIPMGGQFAQPKSHLDPAIFDADEVMHPWIRDTILSRLKASIPDWYPRCRVYLAGSLASYWWDTPDFDVLVGLRADRETCAQVTEELRETFNSPEFIFPGKGAELGAVDLTGYVNPNSYDIRKIKPYAAYELVSNTWFIHPSHTSFHLSQNFWTHAQRLADQADDALNQKNIPACQSIYDKIHSDRNEAFSPLGGGLGDPRALIWVAFARWGLLNRLEKALHPDRAPGHLAPTLAKEG